MRSQVEAEYRPDCVQRSTIAILCVDVTDRDDVSAVGGASIHWLRLHQVNFYLCRTAWKNKIRAEFEVSLIVISQPC